MKFSEEDLRVARMRPYQQLAWVLEFQPISGLTEEQRNTFLQDFSSFTEAQQLGVAGEFIEGYYTIVSLINWKAVSLHEQRVVLDWLSKRSEINSIKSVGGDEELSDAYLQQLIAWGASFETTLFARYYNEEWST